MTKTYGSFFVQVATALTLVLVFGINPAAFATTPEQRALIERHLIPMEGGRNFRDLGGYTTQDGRQIKSGQLFRSGVLHHLTETDYQKIEQLGIRTVVDLRASEERMMEPTLWQAGSVNMMSWDYEMGLGADSDTLSQFANPQLTGPDAEAIMADMYRDMVEQQKPHYAAMFSQLANSPEPLLFHCTAGKDRTGIAAALLLTALGVDRETVIQDYVLSEVIASLPEQQSAAPALSEDMAEMYSFLANMPADALDALMGTRRHYIETAFDEMTVRYGSVDAYMEYELGITEQVRKQLQTQYLQ